MLLSNRVDFDTPIEDIVVKQHPVHSFGYDLVCNNNNNIIIEPRMIDARWRAFSTIANFYVAISGHTPSGLSYVYTICINNLITNLYTKILIA